jgi:septal ring factor EnvC (AmiA/AmiB activator)
MDLMYQVLVQIQTDIASLHASDKRIEQRLSSMEDQYGQILQHLASLARNTAYQNSELDALRNRVERIEKRLEIAE